ncbi:MAG: restriction endonuclease subunit S [Planctomycetaceae bacterium]|nr:MAG: restriction endonuclease subunit S [Planctomycetaceae bacterium]
MKNEWQTKTIGDLCEVIAGQSPDGKFYNSEGRGLPFHQGKKDFGDKFIDAPSTWTTQTTRIAKKGDILMSVRAPVGPVNFSTEEICIGRGLAAIRSGTQLNRDFLFYQLLHLQPEIAGKEGAVFASINKGEIEALPLTFPPLAEQQRIIRLLDEAFEGLATAEASFETNIQNARDLYESHLQSVFKQRGKGWMETSLANVCEFENGDRGKNYPNRNEYVETGVPWINTGHIQPDGTLSMEEMNFITREKFDSLRSGKIQSGDLVYCLRGATLGKTALVDPLIEGAVASSLVILRPSSLLDRSFLYFFLTSPVGKGLIKGFENGAAQPNLGAKSVAKYPVSFPKIPEQKAIVDRLIELREETQRLEAIYFRKLAALATLKKSLLHHALIGEL